MASLKKSNSTTKHSYQNSRPKHFLKSTREDGLIEKSQNQSIKENPSAHIVA